MAEERKEQKQEMKLPDLFVGPLGKAQLAAMRFAAGLATVDSQLAILEKMNKISELLENRETMGPNEIAIAEKLYDELATCIITLHEENSYDTNVKTTLH